MSILELPPIPANVRFAYGDDPNQFGDLYLPDAGGPFAVVVNIHGGFWRAPYDLSHASHLCADLASRGIAAWNIEYRRLGQPGGGWPGTFDDARAAVAHLRSVAERHPLDLARVVLMGHSAGGHLALWVAGERTGIVPRGVLPLAPVADLRRAWELKLSNTVVAELLGGSPDEQAVRYDAASPIERLPLSIPQRLVHGDADDIVPVEISERYVAAARGAGDSARLTTLPGTDHFALIDPRTDAWRTVVTELKHLLAKPTGAKR